LVHHHLVNNYLSKKRRGEAHELDGEAGDQDVAPDGFVFEQFGQEPFEAEFVRSLLSTDEDEDRYAGLGLPAAGAGRRLPGEAIANSGRLMKSARLKPSDGRLGVARL
jgi:hypothetical protein